jgi:hypothetical protein
MCAGPQTIRSYRCGGTATAKYPAPSVVASNVHGRSEARIRTVAPGTGADVAASVTYPRTWPFGPDAPARPAEARRNTAIAVATITALGARRSKNGTVMGDTRCAFAGGRVASLKGFGMVIAIEGLPAGAHATRHGESMPKFDNRRGAFRLGIAMKCDQSGTELPHRAETCPNCGRDVSTITKTGDAVERTGEVTVDVGKKVGKCAVKVGGTGAVRFWLPREEGGQEAEDVGEK